MGVKLSASRPKKDYGLRICYFTFSPDAGSFSLPIVFYTYYLKQQGSTAASNALLTLSSSRHFFRPAAPSRHPRVLRSAWAVKGQRYRQHVPGQ